MRSPLLALLAFLAAAPAHAASLDGLPVDVSNASEPILCAEKDNVTLNFASPQVKAFRIEAAHPVYIGGVREDRYAADWTACQDISAATSEVRPPRKVTFYEDVEVWLTGYTFSNFWRDKNVPFRVGDRVENGLHLVQLWVRRNERAEEVLVLYPADGYWRIRPLPPAHLGWSAYGSSFLVGPVETDGRPLVNIKDVSFDPKTMTFTVAFDRGGSATLKIGALDRDHMTVDVALDQAVQGRPFATLRSMYVTEFNADVARIAVREDDAKGWREEPVMSFKGARATDVWTGRLVPSRHNTSAPDTVFSRFRAAP
ncbi:MAG TPA: hypothetical protein VGU45_12860 [Microvirga sp.]|jgi:hypothetical protein|nr:hypothetical protein [Microvirga sp.]